MTVSALSRESRWVVRSASWAWKEEDKSDESKTKFTETFRAVGHKRTHDMSDKALRASGPFNHSTEYIRKRSERTELHKPLHKLVVEAFNHA